MAIRTPVNERVRVPEAHATATLPELSTTLDEFFLSHSFDSLPEDFMELTASSDPDLENNYSPGTQASRPAGKVSSGNGRGFGPYHPHANFYIPFEEDEHPRGPGGRFIDKGGPSSKPGRYNATVRAVTKLSAKMAELGISDARKASLIAAVRKHIRNGYHPEQVLEAALHALGDSSTGGSGDKTDGKEDKNKRDGDEDNAYNKREGQTKSDHIRELLDKKMSVKDIAKKTGYTYQQVRAVAQKHQPKEGGEEKPEPKPTPEPSPQPKPLKKFKRGELVFDTKNSVTAYEDAQDKFFELLMEGHDLENLRQAITLGKDHNNKNKYLSSYAISEVALQVYKARPLAAKRAAVRNQNKTGEEVRAELKKVKANDNSEIEKLRKQHLELANLNSFDNATLEKMEDLEYKVRKIERAQREKVMKLLEVKNPSKFKTKAIGSMASHKVQSVEKGAEELRRIVGSGAFDDMSVGYKDETQGRSCYRSNDESICMDDYQNQVNVVMHELGHWMEDKDPALLRASLSFLRRRTSDANGVQENLQDLRDLTGNMGYASNERARPDKFHSPYVGKDYFGRASEVVSMGIERLVKDPHEFAENDPEYFDHVVNALRGHY